MKKSRSISIISVVAVLVVWQALAVTVFKDNKALPSLVEVFKRFFVEIRGRRFWQGIGFTFLKGLISFLVSLVLGLILALIAAFKGQVDSFVRPIMSILRSVPTLGVTFILFMFFSGNVTAVVIAALVSLPLIYSIGLSAFLNVDKTLLEMAQLDNLGALSKIKNVYFPSAVPYLYSLFKSVLTLNLKVIIAAEILAVPRLTVGSYLSGAYQAGDFVALFCWVLTAVLLSFLLELLCFLAFRKLKD